jgi:hypothetical protein
VAETGRVRPFVSVTRVGTQLELENRLPADWVVHGYDGVVAGPTTRFNMSIGPGATWPDVAELFLEAPGVTFVAEDGRGAFQAYVVTSPHPYVDVTSAAARGDVAPGGFWFDDVPPGTYDVVAWHPGLHAHVAGGRAPRYVVSPPVESMAHVTGAVRGRRGRVRVRRARRGAVARTLNRRNSRPHRWLRLARERSQLAFGPPPERYPPDSTLVRRRNIP